MKRLVIIRHSKAEEQKFGMRDFDRKLAKRGQLEAPIIAEKLKSLHAIPDLIITSSAARAFQSSLHYAEVFGFPKEKILLIDFIYDHFDVNDLRDLLVETAQESNTVFLFGHNPTLADLAYDLSGSFNDFLPTSGAVGIDFKIDDWKKMKKNSGLVVFFEYPKKQ